MLPIILLFVMSFALARAQTSSKCKDLVLDWGTYPGNVSQDGKLCIYANVRFAGPPTGEFRFQKPQDPSKSDPQPPPGPISCFQVDYGQSSCIPDPKPFNEESSKEKTATCPYNQPSATHTEDCLFLDIYVPLSVINGNQKVPVVVWIYGGAFLFGSKDEFDLSKLPLYSGEGVLEAAAKGSAIFVAGNYRVGIYGWLASSTFKKSGGVPNVGLYDQRKTLQFVQEYIHLLNGDKTQVSAWGESAGAGSIMHHLTANNGEQDPLFTKAILQSPAWQWGWDQQGVIDATYKKFARYAECTEGSIACLRNATNDVLDRASQALFQSDTGCNGSFPVGPSVDGDWVKTLPAVALKKGLFWKKLDSLIVSHVQTEVAEDSGFMPNPIKEDPTDANFQSFVKNYMPQDNLASTRQKIINQYSSNKFRGDQKRRTATVIRDSSFTCNTRQLFNAYHGIGISTWAIYYGLFGRLGKAVHAADLIPTFVNHETDVPALLAQCDTNFTTRITSLVAGNYIHDEVAPPYQARLISHAIHGDPNIASLNTTDSLYWPPAETSSSDQGNKLWKVLTIRYQLPPLSPFSLKPDGINTKEICDFWDGIAEEIMEKYPGPDGTPSNVTTADVSSNFTLSEGSSNTTFDEDPTTSEEEAEGPPASDSEAVPTQPATS